MRTAEAAAAAGVNPQTLRYYERRGLLAEPPRGGSGHREYGPEEVRTVRFIKHAQALGFELRDAEVLLGLARGGPEGCEAARELAEQKIAELDRRIDDLRAMRECLGRLVSTCLRPRAERECPLLHAIADSTTDGQAADAR